MSTLLQRPTRVASTGEIRTHFPALGRLWNGEPVAYFDGPGGTQVPRQVPAAMGDYLVNHNANTHWAFATSQETDQALAGARGAVADFLNAAPQEIAFGANMTTLTFHLARALGRGFGRGDEIVVTELDHHANVDPWWDMARDQGLTVRVAPMDPKTGQLDRDGLRRQVNSRTKLLAIGGASNALGTINDVPEAARMARDVGALLFVDAVHYAPHRLVDVHALGCDFLVCSAYKFYGPHVGVLYGKHDLLQRLDVPKLRPAPNAAPERLETGTQNHEGIVGAAAAIDFLAALAEGATRRDRLRATFDALHARGAAFVDRLWWGLAAIAGVQTYGPPPSVERTPTVAFTVADLPVEAVCQRLADRAIFASHGDFYASTAVARLGLATRGLVRIGCACYTGEEEIDRLLERVRAITKG
jgi:cysteine desulfurase family protein (TIGR01976 family)